MTDTDDEIDAMFDQLEAELSKGKTLHQLAEEEEKNAALFDPFDAPHAVFTALQNALAFDMGRFKSWAAYQSPAIQRSAHQCPPNRIYKHADGPLCWVYGYARYTGRLIVKCIETDLELRDVEPSNVTDVTKALASHFGVALPEA